MHVQMSLCVSVTIDQNEYIAWRAARSFRDAIIKDDTAKQNVINEKCESVLYAVLTAFPRSILTQAQCFRTIAALAFGSDQVSRFNYPVYSSSKYSFADTVARKELLRKLFLEWICT